MHTLKAVFLDRDGVINEIVFYEELGLLDTPFHVDQMKFIPGIEEPLKKMAELGYQLIIVTNQPGLAKKQYSKKTFDLLDQKLRDFFKENSIPLLDIVYALGHPKAKDPKYLNKDLHLRKPKPGMLLEAAQKHGINLKESFMIGDGWGDVAAGNKAGCRTIFIADRFKSELVKLLAEKNVQPTFFVKNMSEAAQIIEKNGGK